MSPNERTDSVDDVLGADHERLGVLLTRLSTTTRDSSPQARAAFDDFNRQLRHHMTWEEESLFPRVKDRATAAQKRSIESLEIDHERLRETLGSLEAALSAGDFVSARSLLDWVETLLKGHNYDEEHGV